MNYPMIHACIRVMDLEKSEAFYQEALGFEIARKKDFPNGKFTLSYLRAPGSDFELELTYNYDQAEPYVIGNGFSHIAVGVENLEESHQRHVDAGFEPTDMKGLSGTASFYFLTDPDGYRVEVVRRS